MKFRSTGVFVSLVAILSVGVLVSEVVCPWYRNSVLRKETRLFHMDSSEIQRIRVFRAKEEIFLEKQEEGWLIRRPMMDIASQNAMELLLETIGEAFYDSVVSENEDLDWKRYGLDDPEGALVIEAGPDQKERVYVGRVEPVGDRRYYRIGDQPKVFVGKSDLFYQIRRSLSEFRSHQIFRKNVDDVIEIHFSEVEKGKGLQLKKVDNSWHLFLGNLKVEQGVTKGFLREVQHLKAKDIVGDDKNDSEARENFNLTSDWAMVEFVFPDRSRWILRMGKPRDSYSYVTVSDRQPIFRIAKTKVERLFLTQERVLKKSDPKIKGN